MTPEAQATTAARNGLVTYDELRGPDLDAGRWSPARLPLPTGGEHIPLDPKTELAVGEGEVRVTIPRFSLPDSVSIIGATDEEESLTMHYFDSRCLPPLPSQPGGRRLEDLG